MVRGLNRSVGYAVLLVALATVTACALPTGAPDEAEPASQVVTIEELHTMLETEDFLFVNVHIPFDGDIPGTDVSIPYNDSTAPHFLDTRIGILTEHDDPR
jgi:hypothetical protein